MVTFTRFGGHCHCPAEPVSSQQQSRSRHCLSWEKQEDDLLLPVLMSPYFFFFSSCKVRSALQTSLSIFLFVFIYFFIS